jgi:glycosyltransferase involved in cell wall biosynthesis
LINYTDTAFSGKENTDTAFSGKENTDTVNNSKKNNTNNTKKYKFGVISRFSDDKNIPMLIISLVLVFRKYPNYKCYFVGSDTVDYDTYLKYLCKIYNIENNVQFEGYQIDTKKYYNMFDFVILPSVSEGCAFNIIETFISGIPIICSNVGGNHELVINNINGYIYDYTDIRDYEKSVVYITSYNEHLSKIGYLINDNLDKNYIFNNSYKNLNVIIPFSLKCKNISPKCQFCNILNNKMNLFNKNTQQITNIIIKMIETPIENIHEMSKNNIKFINDNFNKIIYNKQLLDIINIVI